MIQRLRESLCPVGARRAGRATGRSRRARPARAVVEGAREPAARQQGGRVRRRHRRRPARARLRRAAGRHDRWRPEGVHARRCPTTTATQKSRASRPNSTVTLHWVKERELPAVDDEFAQQVGEYADVAALRTAIDTQLREREEQRVREQARGRGDEQAGRDLVDRVSAAARRAPGAAHARERSRATSSSRACSCSSICGWSARSRSAFEQEMRDQAETQRATLAGAGRLRRRPRRSTWRSEADEVRRAAQRRRSVEQRALADPTTRQRCRNHARTKAMARLIEVAGPRRLSNG